VTNLNQLSTNVSVVHRSSQKFYDKYGEQFGLGAGQFNFLIAINEYEGITMKALAQSGAYDKALVSKAVNKLTELGLVRTEINRDDKRERFLFSTDRTKEIMKDLYLIRRDWFNQLTKGLSEAEIAEYLRIQQRIADNALNVEEQENIAMEFFGFQKLTLLDYPGKMAATVFTGGCNMRCPFCHNADLVFLPADLPSVSAQEVLAYLKKRQGVLEGICISGGEPLLHAKQLRPFLVQCKALGLSVKIDTNGSYPEVLAAYIAEGLVDYVAMDVKNGLSKYPETSGLTRSNAVWLKKIQQSIDLLINGGTDYEFRTTVVAEYHEASDMDEIGKLIEGAKRCYLQKFVDSGKTIAQGLHARNDEEMVEYAEILKKYVKEVGVRGIGGR